MSRALLLTPSQLIDKLPANREEYSFVHQNRETIASIISGNDPRLLLIVGPCSIHDTTSTLEYAQRLAQLRDQVKSSFFVIMRLHYEKPRTALGWKGFLYDPYLDGSHQMDVGIEKTRELLLEVTKLGVPIATEILDPLAALYFDDLISWGCIGARTASSQVHRQVASGLPFPVAFKNNTDGNIQIAIDGALSSSTPHTFLGLKLDGTQQLINTNGNPHSHIVLRGGASGPNYSPRHITEAKNALNSCQLTQSILIDSSHDNSQRNHHRQPQIFKEVIEQVIQGEQAIKGLILESHLHSGRQLLPETSNQLRHGVSITDPCIDWDTTDTLIRECHHKLQAKTCEVALV